MKCATSRSLFILVTVLALVLHARGNAQELSKADTTWASTLVTSSIRVEWLSEDRARATLMGQDGNDLRIEATSVTVTTLPDGLKIQATGQAVLSSDLRQSPRVESLELTVSRTGGVFGTVHR